MKNKEYTLGDALMEERKSEAKWIVREKLCTLYNAIENHSKELYIEKCLETINDILNIVECEL